MIYLFVILLLLGCSIKFDSCYGQVSGLRGMYLFLFILFVIVAGFRYLNGGDTLNYYSAFLQSPDLSSISKLSFNDSRYQPGFVAFMAFCKSLSTNFVVMQMLVSFVFNLIIFLFVKKESVVPFLSILLYFILNYFELNMEVMRECLAVGSGIVGYMALNNKKTIIYILCFLIAYSMHVSALVLLLFPFINGMIFSKRGFAIIFVMIVVIPFLYMSVPNIELYANMIFNQEDWITSSYITQEFNSSLNIYFYIRHIVVWVFLPMYSVYFLHKCGEEKFTGYIYAFVILHLLSMISYAFYRFANYFAPFWWVVLSLFIVRAFEYYNIKQKALSLSFVLLLLLYFYQYEQLLFDSNKQQYLYERYIPYNSVLINNSYN